MNRAIQFVAVLLAIAVIGLCEQKGSGKAPPPARGGGAAARPKDARQPPAGARGGAPKGPPVTNPGNIAAHLLTASPEERERVLEKLPPERQEQARKQLEAFDKLPKEQQEIRIRQAQRLAALPPEKRREFQQSFQAFQHLEQDRKRAVGGALRRLQMMDEEQRTQVLNSDQFKSRFSVEEQKIILDLSDVILPPLQ